MNVPRDFHTGWSKSHGEGETLYDIPYMWNPYRLREQTWFLGLGNNGEGIVREFGIDMYTLLYLNCIINKDLLDSTRSLLSTLQWPIWEKTLKKSGYVYKIAELVCCTPETNPAYMCTQSCLTLCNPMDCGPPYSSAQMNFPSKNTEVGCHFLFQGILLTQG